jgi:hypothetical protein
LLNLMQFNSDFDETLVAQFLATVHFGTDEARTITWMTKDEHFNAVWKDFYLVLGYDDQGIHIPMGFHPHEKSNASQKEVLADLYIAGEVLWEGPRTCSRCMISCITFTIMGESKVGNLDQIHGYLVDLMLRTHTEKGKGIPLDVPHYLWNEMFNVVMNRKVPTFAPYIMKFISVKWAESRPGEHLERNVNNLTIHDVKKLIIKKHGKPHRPTNEEVFADTDGSSGDDFELPPRATMTGWVAKVQSKIRNTFCL